MSTSEEVNQWHQALEMPMAAVTQILPKQSKTPAPAPAPAQSPLYKVREQDVFQGKRSATVIKGWLRSLEYYFAFVHLKSKCQMFYAATLVQGPADIWCCIPEQAKTAPTNWDDFNARLTTKFVPLNAHWDAQDRLTTLKLVEGKKIKPQDKRKNRLKSHVFCLRQGRPCCQRLLLVKAVKRQCIHPVKGASVCSQPPSLRTTQVPQESHEDRDGVDMVCSLKKWPMVSHGDDLQVTEELGSGILDAEDMAAAEAAGKVSNSASKNTGHNPKGTSKPKCVDWSCEALYLTELNQVSGNKGLSLYNGYAMGKKIQVLIDLGATANYVSCRLANDLPTTQLDQLLTINKLW
ncbi:hypothetical protein F4703DRAFT_1798610 [Phycomyces blakesleeanus]